MKTASAFHKAYIQENQRIQFSLQQWCTDFKLIYIVNLVGSTVSPNMQKLNYQWIIDHHISWMQRKIILAQIFI